MQHTHFVFDEEADTTPLDVSEVLRSATIEVRTSDVIAAITASDTLRAEPMIEFDDTPVFVPVPQDAIAELHPTFDEAPPTDKQTVRPSTNGDWPPEPKPPTERTKRRAGMYKAITSITKLTKAPSP